MTQKTKAKDCCYGVRPLSDCQCEKDRLAALAAEPAVGGEDWSCVADFLDDIEVDDKGMCRWSDVANAQTLIRQSMRSAQPASPLRGREIPDGATHMRRPEYLTAWLFDGVATMPLWLIERYHSLPLPEHRKGCYALAVDGELWRWMDVEKFDELYVSASPPEQPAAASLERLPVEKLARHFRVSVAQAKAAQDDIGFMYRELAVPAAAPFQPHENCNCLMCIAEKPRDES